MNCKKVEELLPLYVGRDLTEENARLVTTHLHGCTQCALSAREYGEANQLLQMFEPPQFSDAAYAAVRSSVWREIERKSSAPRLIEFFKRPLPLHVTWAVSLAVMVVVGAFAYYFLADRMSQQGYRQPLAATGGPGKQNPPDEPLNTGTVASGVDRSLNGLLAPPAPANGSRKPRLNRPKLNLTIGLVSHSWKAGGSSTSRSYWAD